MTGPPELKMPARKSCGHFRLCRAVKTLPGCGVIAACCRPRCRCGGTRRIRVRLGRTRAGGLTLFRYVPAGRSMAAH